MGCITGMSLLGSVVLYAPALLVIIPNKEGHDYGGNLLRIMCLLSTCPLMTPCIVHELLYTPLIEYPRYSVKGEDDAIGGVPPCPI